MIETLALLAVGALLLLLLVRLCFGFETPDEK